MRWARAVTLVTVTGACVAEGPTTADPATDLPAETIARAVGPRAIEPRVDPAGRRVAFAEMPPGAGAYQPGTPTRLAVIDLGRGTRRVVSEDPLDSSPVPVPGTDEVLFVSGRTGLASLWLSAPGRPDRQLTNVGMRRLEPGFVPPPRGDLSFSGRTASYQVEGRSWSVSF